MDQLKKNKFLSAFLAVLILGVLALGFLCYRTWSSYGEAQTKFTDAKNAVERLKGAALFPSTDNLKKRVTQVDAYKGKVDELVKRLMTYQVEFDPSSDETKFQPKLADLIKKSKDGAAGASIKIDDSFDFGMKDYLSAAPRKEAVPDLNFALDGMKAFVDLLINSRISTIASLTRKPLDIEADNKTAAPAPGAKPASSGKSSGLATSSSALAESDVIRRYSFTVKFSGTPQSVEDVFTAIASTPENSPFFAVRLAKVENEKKTAQKSSGGTDEKKEGHDSSLILGGEKVGALLEVDLIRFLDPAAVAKAKEDAKAGGSSKSATAKPAAGASPR